MTFQLVEPILLIGLGGVGARLAEKAKKSLNSDCLLISHDQKDLTSENSIKISTKSVVNPSTHLIRGSTLETSDEIKKNIRDEFFKDVKYQPRMKIDTKVALVKYHPGYDPKLIENLIQTGCKAIIFEGTGLGHVGRTMYDVIKNAKENDLFLGMTSQCLDGRVRMTVYESGRDLLELGIIPLENMTPETSLVKAMWALGNSKNADEMKSLMLENIASEF